MDNRTYEKIEHWAIAFSKDSNSPLWKRICPGEYKHVSLLRFSARADTWLYLDVNFSGLDVVVGPGDTEVIEAINWHMGDVDILTFPVICTSPFSFRGVFTCVQFVKHALGIRAPFVITPDQLYKYLIRRGADIWTVRRPSSPP